MKDIHKMRLGVLRELKNVRRFFDNMERSIKTHNPVAIQKAYMFLRTMVIMMDSGELSPKNVELNLELLIALEESEEMNNEQ